MQSLYEPRTSCTSTFKDPIAFEILTYLEELAKIYKRLDRDEIQSFSRDYGSLSAQELLSLLTASLKNYVSLLQSCRTCVENISNQIDDLLLVSLLEADLNNFLDQLQKTIHSFNYCVRILESYSREVAKLEALKEAYLKSFLREKKFKSVAEVSERLSTLELAREKSRTQPNLLRRLKNLLSRRSKIEDSHAVSKLESEIRELERFLELAQTCIDDSANFFRRLLKQKLQVLATRVFTQLVDALDREVAFINVATEEGIFLTREQKEELVEIYLNHCVKPLLEYPKTQQSSSAEDGLEAIDQTLEEYKKYLLGEIENLEESEKLREIKLSLHSKYCELPDRRQFWDSAQRYLKILDQSSILKLESLIFFVRNLKKLTESLPPELIEPRIEMRLYDLEKSLLTEIQPNLALAQYFNPLIWRAVKMLVSKNSESDVCCDTLETWLIDELLTVFQKSQQDRELRFLGGGESQEFRILGLIRGLGRKDSILPILLISIGANSADIRRTAVQIFWEMLQREDSRNFLKQVFEKYKVAGFAELECFLKEFADKADESDFFDRLVTKLFDVCEDLLCVLLNEHSFYRFFALKGLSMSQKTQRFSSVLASLGRRGDLLALEALIRRALGLFVDSRAGVDGFALGEVFKLLDEEVCTKRILEILSKHATVKPQEVRSILQRNLPAAERSLLELLEDEEAYPLTQFIVSPSITTKLLELAQKRKGRAAEALFLYHLPSLGESLVTAYLAQRFCSLGSPILEELDFNITNALQDSRVFLFAVLNVVSQKVSLQLTKEQFTNLNQAIDFVLELEQSGQTILALTYVSLIFDAIGKNSQEFEPQQKKDEPTSTKKRNRKKLNLEPLIDPRSLNLTRQLNAINPVAARAFLHHVAYFQGKLDDLLKDYENLLEEERKAGLKHTKADSSWSWDNFFEDIILTVLTEDQEKFKQLRQSIFGSSSLNLEASRSEQFTIAWQLFQDESVRSWFNLVLERFLNQGMSEQEAKVKARTEIIRQGQADMLYHGTSFSRANQILEGLGLRALNEKGLPGAFVTDSLQAASQFAYEAFKKERHSDFEQAKPAILYTRALRLIGQEIKIEPVGVLDEPIIARFKAVSPNGVSLLSRVPARYVSTLSCQPEEDFKVYQVYPGFTSLDSRAWLLPQAQLAKKVAKKEKLRRAFKIRMDELKKSFKGALLSKKPEFLQELDEIYNHLRAENSSYTKIIEILDTYILAALEDSERSRKLCKIYEDFAKQSKYKLAFIHDYFIEYPEALDLITESDSVNEIVHKLNFYIYDQQRAALESSRTIISKLNHLAYELAYEATGLNDLHLNSNELHSILVNLSLGGWTDEKIMSHFKSALRKISSARKAIFENVVHRALSSVPASIEKPSDDQFTVVLTASVGREESSFESDLDFLIFVESDETYRQFEEFFVIFRKALLEELEKLNFVAPDFGLMHICQTFVTPERLQGRISPFASRQYVEPTVILDARAVYGAEELVHKVQQALAFKLIEEREAWLQFLKEKKLEPFKESLRNGLDQLIAGDPPGDYKVQFRRIIPFMVYYLVSTNIEKFSDSDTLKLPRTTSERLEKLAELGVLDNEDAKFLKKSYELILQLYTRYSLVEQSSHPKANLYILTLEERERLQYIAEELLRLFDKYITLSLQAEPIT
jgi:hypothetical protein